MKENCINSLNTISKSTIYDNLKSPFNKVSLIDQGNIKPVQLYEVITFHNSKPDYLAIDLYSDIRSWYKPKKHIENDGNVTYISKLKSKFYKTSYCYLAKKYNVSKETIRAKLVKLENLGLLSRAFTTEKRFYNREENNVLNILVWKNSSHFTSLIGLEKTIELNDLCYKKFNPKDLVPSPDLSGDIYSITNNFSCLKKVKSRSYESNFLETKVNEESKQNAFCKPSLQSTNLKQQITNKVIQEIAENPSVAKSESIDKSKTTIIPKITNKEKSGFISMVRKPLAEFHPVSQDDVKYLQRGSNREFNVNYVNKLILKLAEEKPEHGFYTKDLFMSYMKIALKEEKRLERNANNLDFNFKVKGDLVYKNKYLNDLEMSLDTSSTSHLRKKIAALFEIELAYNILTNCTFPVVDNLRDISNEFKYVIETNKELNLTNVQLEILLEQIQAVYGQRVQNISFSLSNNVQKITTSVPELNFGKPGTIWNKISLKLLEYYGDALHRSWFSKLEVEENEVQQNLIVKAPTNFIKDWLKSNYAKTINELAKSVSSSIHNIEIVT